MSKKIYKAAVIGCGKIGAEENNYQNQIRPATHAAAHWNNARIELAGLCDSDYQKLEKAKEFFTGVPLYLSAEEMLQKVKPDIVSIATHPGSHAKLVKLAANYKTKAIICEKPIATSLDQAREMIKICRKNKSLLFINHQRRFDPLLRRWREKIKKGLVGDIIQCNCHYYNGLFNSGTHSIDLLRFFLGDINWVISLANKRTSWKKDDKDVDAFVGFKSGARAVLQALPQNYGLVDFCFYGTKGSFMIKKLGYEIEYRKLEKNKYFNNYFQLSDETKRMGKTRSFMKAMADHIVSCLDNKTKPMSTGEDGLAAIRVLYALKESAAKGGKIIKIK